MLKRVLRGYGQDEQVYLGNETGIALLWGMKLTKVEDGFIVERY